MRSHLSALQPQINSRQQEQHYARTNDERHDGAHLAQWTSRICASSQLPHSDQSPVTHTYSPPALVPAASTPPALQSAHWCHVAGITLASALLHFMPSTTAPLLVLLHRGAGVSAGTGRWQLGVPGWQDCTHAGAPCGTQHMRRSLLLERCSPAIRVRSDMSTTAADSGSSDAMTYGAVAYRDRLRVRCKHHRTAWLCEASALTVQAPAQAVGITMERTGKRRFGSARHHTWHYRAPKAPGTSSTSSQGIPLPPARPGSGTTFCSSQEPVCLLSRGGCTLTMHSAELSCWFEPISCVVVLRRMRKWRLQHATVYKAVSQGLSSAGPRMCCCIAGVSRLVDSWTDAALAMQGTQHLTHCSDNQWTCLYCTLGVRCTLGCVRARWAFAFASACQCSCDHQPLLGASLSTSR
jgi:hypothetical protein